MIWGSAFVAQRVGMDSIEPITFNAARMALAAPAVGLVWLLSGRRKGQDAPPRSGAERRARTRSTVLGGVCCGAFLALGSIFQQMGLVTTTAGKAGFLTAMYILLVPLIGAVFLKKKPAWPVWPAVALGVAGLYLLCMTESLRLGRGDTLVCVCAVFFACHILCCDHFVRRGDALGISAIQFAAAAVISAAAAAVLEEPTWPKLVSALVPILYCGLVSDGLGYTLQMVAQKFTDPTVASLLMSLESVFAVISGAVLLREQVSARELLGCFVMFAAIILVQLPLPGRRAGTDR